MAWDTGTIVDVVGEDFIGALELAVGDEAREGDIAQPLDGQALRVRGRVLVTDAGVTAVKVGLEVQTADRATTDLVVYNVPLPAVDAWGAFEGWIQPGPEFIYGRGYLAVEGTAGEAQLGTINCERAGSGMIKAGDVVPGDLTNSWPKRFGPTNVTNGASTGVLLAERTFTSKGGPLEVIVSTDINLTAGGNCELYIYIDATYAGGSSPTGYRRKSIKKTATSSDIRDAWTIHEPVGDPDDIGTDPLLTAGSHTIRLYCRNASGAAVDFDDGSMQIREYGNDEIA